MSDVRGEIKYGGADASGNTGAEVIREYYEDNDWKEVRLVELKHCEVVDESDIRESDEEWIKTISEKYAYCFVQTADTVICEEDCETGLKGETVQRCNVIISMHL